MGAEVRHRSKGKTSITSENGGDEIKDSASSVAPRSAWSKAVRFSIFAALTLLPPVALFISLEIPGIIRHSVLISLGFSVLAFMVTVKAIPLVTPYVLKRNMFGYDINKRGSPAGEVKIPESQGLVVAIVFLVAVILFQHFYFSPDSNWLVEYNAALVSICFMAFLGFIDDVLDIPWRVKLLLPTIASLPLLMAYSGQTTILIPKPLRSALGFEQLDLGWVYKLYMGMLAVFCSNSINILAGVNGVEAGQTVVIASSVLCFNVWQIGSFGTSKPSLREDLQQAHLFSIYLMQPLIGCTLGLLSYNWYPSSVFVGDTFTYFAGMALAVVGILGHFSETLLLFFLPQIINFIYSIPQLFKIVPCPRHRLPKFDPVTGLLTGSNDMNLVNLFLRLFGRCTEQALCVRLLLFQGLCTCICFLARYLLTGVYK